MGQDARDRALAADARAGRRNPREPQGAGGTRNAQRRQGDLERQGRGGRRGRELPLLRLRHRVDRGPLASARRVAALLLVARAGRRLRADRPLELPGDDGRLEALTRPRGRVHGRPQARSSHASDGAPSRRARRRGRDPAGRRQRRPRRRADHRRVSRRPPGRGQGVVHRIDALGQRGDASGGRARQAALARAGRQEPEPDLRRREPRGRDPELGLRRSTTRPARAATPAPAFWSRSRSTTTSSRRSPTPRSASRSAIRSTPRRRWAR